jgi:hypothetical protein
MKPTAAKLLVRRLRCATVPIAPQRAAGILPAETLVPRPSPLAPSEWPIWAAALSFFKSEKDRGVGDTVERIIGKNCSKAYKTWYQSTFGKPCGCTDRKAKFNSRFPYS